MTLIPPSAQLVNVEVKYWGNVFSVRNKRLNIFIARIDDYKVLLASGNVGEVFYYLENVQNIFIKYYLSRPCIRIFPSFLFFSLKWQDLNALTNQFNAFG